MSYFIPAANLPETTGSHRYAGMICQHGELAASGNVQP
jgi:hypothetical protein